MIQGKLANQKCFEAAYLRKMVRFLCESASGGNVEPAYSRKMTVDMIITGGILR